MSNIICYIFKGWRWSSKKLIWSFSRCNLVVVWIYYHRFVYSKFGSFFDCFKIGDSSGIIRWFIQTVQNSIFAHDRIRFDDLFWKNGLHWGKVLWVRLLVFIAYRIQFFDPHMRNKSYLYSAPFVILLYFPLPSRIWKAMSLNDSMTVYERSKLAVWDYPVSDRYTKMWQSMIESGLPATFEEALKRVRASPSSSEGYAFLGRH